MHVLTRICFTHLSLCLFMIIGKTLLAKAVANQTAATFLRVVGSELIQKYLVKEKILFLLLPNNLIFFKLDQKMILVKQG